MKKILLTLLSLLSFSFAFAAVPNHDQPKTFLGPTFKLGMTSNITDITAFSIFGDAGPREGRVNGTLAWQIAQNQRFKVSGEWLGQYITYPFYTGNTKHWINQGAVGGEYQFDFAGFPYTQFDVKGYYEYAQSKSLSTIVITSNTVTQSGLVLANVIETITNARRIAGSKGGGVAPGIYIQPWWGSKIGLSLNYDNVLYDTKYSNQHPNGVGVTGEWNEHFTDNIMLSLLASDRQIFNNYAASLTWTSIPYYGTWAFSVYGEYTQGKHNLPDTYNVGLSAHYLLDKCFEPKVEYFPYANAKGEIPNYKGEMPMMSKVTGTDDITTQSLIAWTADPAVFMPVVLAIPDELVDITTTTNIVNLCSPVVLIGSLPDFAFDPGPDDTPAPIPPVNAATVFTGSAPITYTMTYFITSEDPASEANLTINSATGQITGTIRAPNNNPFTVTVTVTASNACGSASDSFVISVSVD